MELYFCKKFSDAIKNQVVFVDEKCSSNKDTDMIKSKFSIDVLAVLKNNNFESEFGKSFTVPTSNPELHNVIVVSLGKIAELDKSKYMKLGGKIFSLLACRKLENIGINANAIDNVCEVAFGAELKSYKFDKYWTDHKKKQKHVRIEILADKADELSKEYKEFQAVISGIKLTKSLVSEPANVIYPASFASHCEELKELGVEVEVLGQKEMAALGMNTLLGVGLGSAKEPKMVIMKWNGGKGGEAPIAFCGKGVTFDSGGLSIKPAASMEDMKHDMAGAAVVAGLMKTIAMRKAKVNVVCVAGLVENMTGSNAQRPGDVVTSMSGQTVEILNTDAEGRLVLADVLWYTQSKFDPKIIVDLATLTGAIVIALADLYAGLFSNNDELSEKLTKAGVACEEKIWRFPMGPEYDKLIDSSVADMQNISNRSGSGGGSITAAQFLQRFVNKKPWAHLDIAGTCWSKQGGDYHEKGATAFGLRLLNQFIIDNYEK